MDTKKELISEKVEKEIDDKSNNNEFISEKIIQDEKIDEKNEKLNNRNNTKENINSNNENKESTESKENILNENPEVKDAKEDKKPQNSDISYLKEKEEKEEQKNTIQQNEEENKDLKINNTKEKKPKGFVRIFRKFIKKKNELLESIINKKFTIWKMEALIKRNYKKKKFRRILVVKISLSKNKDKKKRNISELIQKDFHNYKISNSLQNDSKSNSLNKDKNKPNKNNINNLNLVKNWQIMSLKDNKKEKNLFYNKINNNKFNTFKKKIIKNNKENPISLKNRQKEKKEFLSPNNRLDKKYISIETSENNSSSSVNMSRNKNRIYQKNYNNSTTYYSSKDKDPFNQSIEKKYKTITIINDKNQKNTFNAKNLKNLSINNISNNFNNNLTNNYIYSPNYSVKTINTEPKIKEPRKVIKVFKPYNNKKYIPKKYIPLSRNFLGKKKEEKTFDFKTDYLNRNWILCSPKKNNNSRNGSDINQYPFNREFILNSPKTIKDENNLKKGITTVIQHYSFIKEQFNNYEINNNGFNTIIN